MYNTDTCTYNFITLLCARKCEIIHVASKFLTTDDVARNLTLLAKLLICTHKHTYTHIHT